MKGHAGMLSIPFGNGSGSSYRPRFDQRAERRRLEETVGIEDGVSPLSLRCSLSAGNKKRRLGSKRLLRTRGGREFCKFVGMNTVRSPESLRQKQPAPVRERISNLANLLRQDRSSPQESDLQVMVCGH